ncbi:MAG TPA: isocitrate lyase/phosphoenolpyruvate mutase family protein [Trebonia sp.]
MATISEQAANLRQRWATDPRWAGIERMYSAEDVIRLRGSVMQECTPARLGATRLWDLLNSQDAIRALGAASGSQAVRMVSAGLQAIYLSGRHASANPAPTTVRRVNRALLREGRAVSPEDASAQKWLAPVVSDAEAGCGEVLNAFELMTDMIEAGAAGVHFDDQLSGDKEGGQLGGKVLIPTGQHIKALNAARLAADVLDVPALVIARTAAIEATLLTSDADERDHEFLTGEQTAEGLHQVRPGLYACVTRGLAFAPYADLLWLETGTPDLAEARAFAQIIHSQYPDKMLAYSCSPSCDWSEHLDDVDIEKFQKELAVLGYRFQFITPAGFDTLDQSVSGPASGDVRRDVSSFIPRQEAECSGGALGYSATAGRHESEAGTGYHDLVTRALAPETLIAAPAVPVETAYFVGHDQLDHHGRLVPAD